MKTLKEKREFYLGDEEKLKDKIIEILINKDGKYGPYKHGKFAEYFSHFNLKIVPIGKEPETAAISYDDGIVYVNEGFISDDDYLYQLNVIMRHELAHNLLGHQIRMTAKLGRLPFSHISTSKSLWDMLNTIEDFEISNRKYSEEDKKIMLNLWVNGEYIKALVTEMHRKDWLKLSLEQMYEKLSAELDAVTKAVNNKMSGDYYWEYDLRKDLGFEGKYDMRNDMIINQAIGSKMLYSELPPSSESIKTANSMIWQPAEEYFKKSKFFKKMAKPFQEALHNSFEFTKDFSETQLKDLWKNIAGSKPFETIKLKDDDDKFWLVTPEEKYLAVQAIKYHLGFAGPRPKTTVVKVDHSEEYRKKYNEIIRKYGKRGVLSAEEIVEILGNIEDNSSESEPSETSDIVA